MLPKSLVPVAVATLLGIVVGSPMSALADDSTFGLLNSDWETFAGSAGMASYAWAGENETFSARIGMLGAPLAVVDFDDSDVDVELVTGLPAPEPPGLVLAGLAFGGVVCGRSLVLRRRKTVTDTSLEFETSRG